MERAYRRLIPRYQLALLGIISSTVLSTTVARAALPPGNTVQQWNQIAENIVVGVVPYQNEGLIYMAYVSAAVYDAAAAIDGRYAPYASAIAAPPGALLDAAVIEAAYTTLREYFPGQAATLDAMHAEALSAIPNGAAKAAGQEVGAAAAARIIALRAHDGRRLPYGTTSPIDEPPFAPGRWRRTPDRFDPPQTPWVGSVQPFILANVRQFHPHPPANLNTQRWVDQFSEIQRLGGVVSTDRSAEQTAIATFWVANVIRQYNRLAREVAAARNSDLMETARLLAMVNIVGADAQISVMHWKYEFLFWRPVTAIDPTAVTAADLGPVPGYNDGNRWTVEQENWRSLLPTPNHPEYPAAHGSITSAMAEVFSEFLHTEGINLDVHGSTSLPPNANLNAVRHFDTADDLRIEIINARLWAGLHYRESSEAGVDLGRKVARYDLDHAFRPQ
jgi:vanadium-dependent haloperoxidase-like protein